MTNNLRPSSLPMTVPASRHSDVASIGLAEDPIA